MTSPVLIQIYISIKINTVNLSLIHVDSKRAVQSDSEFREHERHYPRFKVRQLLWLADQNHQDLFFDVCSLATNIKQ